MPWAKVHKKETRDKILDAAAAAFRKGGISDVSVGEIMDDAGLTHGGFYAHFKSKDELVSEALVRAEMQTGERLGAADGLLAHSSAYLSKLHLGHPEGGCAIAAVGTELVRSSAPVRRRFASNIQKRLEKLRSLVTSRSEERRKRQAAGALACMVGGMIIARGLGETAGEEFLGECRAFLSDALRSPERSAAD